MDRSVTTEQPAGSDRTSQVLRLADGRRIGYAEYGDPEGASVLAIHGTPGSRFMFALTDKAARERGLRIVAPERPGYGLSDYRRKDGLARAADDMSAFADALGLRRFAVIGVSGGGPYAVAAAAAMADRIALLALISPVGPIAECQSKHPHVEAAPADLHQDGPLRRRPAPPSSGRCARSCAMRRRSPIAR